MIMIAFLIYITLKGELTIYMGFFSPGASTPVNNTWGGGTVSGTPVGTTLGIPGVTTLSPGATGIVQGPGGTEILNPGPAYNPFSGMSLSNFQGFGQPYTGGK